MTAFIVTAPTSGAGKTTITLGLMRALKRKGIKVKPAKSGPDYIDPAFHTVASGTQSVNLDAWAMSPKRIRHVAPSGNLIVEGAMGFFDGAGIQGTGSAHSLAAILGIPYVLVIDASKTAHSVRAAIRGVLTEAAPIKCAGVIFNKVGSDRHAKMLRHAVEPLEIDVLGHIFRSNKFALPERHLGLVQAGEHQDLSAWIDCVADVVETQIDLSVLADLPIVEFEKGKSSIPPPAQSIAVANDIAFAFSYPHLIAGWLKAGAQVTWFSPLANEPVPESDFVFLPGGYPELHAGVLSKATTFFNSLRTHAKTKPVYGECGGYMVLGKGLTDASGQKHAMAGLLDLETSFAERRLHLGYRVLSSKNPLFTGLINAHEFHYATTAKANGQPLFSAKDADGITLNEMGLQDGKVCGSFAHIIDGF